jgi:hypothetical protein
MEMLPQAYAIPAVATAVEGFGPALAPLAIGAALAVLAAFLFLVWGAIVHAPTAGLFVSADAWDVAPERPNAPEGDDDEAEEFDFPRLVA